MTVIVGWAMWLSPWAWSTSDWAGVTFLAIALGAIPAWRQVRESQRLREEQARPFVVVDFHPWSSIIELKIRNVGKTLAREVRFEFDQPLKTTHDAGSGRGTLIDLNLFTSGIPSLAPEKEITVFFDQFPARIQAGLPMTYTVQVSYKDPAGKPYSEPTVLDLAMYIGTGGITRYGLHEIHKQLEVIAKETKKWTAFGGGIKTMSPSDLKRRERELDEYYADRAAAISVEATSEHDAASTA